MPGDVGDGRAGNPVRAVTGRKRLLVALVQVRSVLFSVLLDQRVAEIVAPGARRLHQPRLDLGDVEVGRNPVRAAHPVVHAHQHRLAQLRPPVEEDAAEGLEQDLPNPFAVVGVVAIARNRDQALDEPVEPVAAHEQAHALALAEPQHAHRDGEQLVGLDLKQRVPRIGLEDLGQHRLLVATRGERCTAEHSPHLAAQPRDLAGALLVRGRGVETQEPTLTETGTVRSEALDADVVEIRRTVHGGTRIGLGQHQRVPPPRDLERLRAQLRVRPAPASPATSPDRSREQPSAPPRRPRERGRTRDSRGT